MTKQSYLTVVGLVLGMAGGSAFAAEQPTGLIKLEDRQLDQVTAGADLGAGIDQAFANAVSDENDQQGSLLDLDVDVLLKDITVSVNISDVPITAAVGVQANALGTAQQTLTVQAFQGLSLPKTTP